jgi:hypothetical protein
MAAACGTNPAGPEGLWAGHWAGRFRQTDCRATGIDARSCAFYWNGTLTLDLTGPGATVTGTLSAESFAYPGQPIWRLPIVLAGNTTGRTLTLSGFRAHPIRDEGRLEVTFEGVLLGDGKDMRVRFTLMDGSTDTEFVREVEGWVRHE